MSNKIKNLLLVFVVIISGFYYFYGRSKQSLESYSHSKKVTKIKAGLPLGKMDKIQIISNNRKEEAPLVSSVEKTLVSPVLSLKKETSLQLNELKNVKKQAELNSKASKFKLEDGLVTVAGDIVLGVPKTSDFPTEGWIETPEFSLWESSEIPFHIQANLPNQERIYEAFELFKDSPIHFLALTEQSDAIVFEEKNGACKSYVGKVGGLQPIWIGADCSPADIAHEIMHALGFIHEQNRADRDGFIEILWDNIQEEYKYNFEMLPVSFMKVSGAVSFDFDSLMIYPQSSFAKTNGLTTLKAKINRQIKPSLGLSNSDLERLHKFYGR